MSACHITSLITRPLFIHVLPAIILYRYNTGSLAHLFLDTGRHWLDLGDQRGWVETAMRGHRGAGLVHLCSLLLRLLNVLINCLSLGWVHYSSNVNPLEFMCMGVQVFTHDSINTSMCLQCILCVCMCVCVWGGGGGGCGCACTCACVCACVYAHTLVPLLSSDSSSCKQGLNTKLTEDLKSNQNVILRDLDGICT